LTVTDVSAADFSVSIIPHTAAVTTLSERKAGDSVNLENDIIGKYVERLLLSPDSAEVHKAAPASGITKEFLSQHGF
jgi:riboflavin synthase